MANLQPIAQYASTPVINSAYILNKMKSVTLQWMIEECAPYAQENVHGTNITIVSLNMKFAKIGN